jgi:hypothetical protein
MCHDQQIDVAPSAVVLLDVLNETLPGAVGTTIDENVVHVIGGPILNPQCVAVVGGENV